MTTDDFDVEDYARVVIRDAIGGSYLPLTWYGYLFADRHKPYLARERFELALLSAMDRELISATIVNSPPAGATIFAGMRKDVATTDPRPMHRDDVEKRIRDRSIWDPKATTWIRIDPTDDGMSFWRERDAPRGFMDELERGGVVYPWMRINLRDTMDVLASPDVTTIRETEEWRFNDAINDIPDNGVGNVGWYVRDEDEEALLAEVVDAFYDIWASKQTGEFQSEAWEQSKFWPRLAKAAAKLRDRIAEDSQPDMPTDHEIENAFALVLEGDRHPHEASNWAAQWMVFGRDEGAAATWDALEALSRHAVDRSKMTPEIETDLARARSTFRAERA